MTSGGLDSVDHLFVPHCVPFDTWRRSCARYRCRAPATKEMTLGGLDTVDHLFSAALCPFVTALSCPRTEEMMQSCLICLHAVSLVASPDETAPKR